jgi:hypothetical protein
VKENIRTMLATTGRALRAPAPAPVDELQALRDELREHAEVIARLVWLKNHGYVATVMPERDRVGAEAGVAECLKAWPQAQELVKRKMWREKHEKDVAALASGDVIDVPATVVR